MSNENSKDEEVFELDKAVAEVRAATPEGWSWKLRVEDEGHSLYLRLVRRGWLGITLAGYGKSYGIPEDRTQGDFYYGVLQRALEIVKERAEKMAVPDFAELAKKLQAALNGR